MGTLVMRRGDSFAVDIELPGEIAEGTFFSFVARRYAGEAGDALVRKDNKARGGVSVAAGVLTVALAPADTLALPNEHRIYSYEITRRNPEGEHSTLDYGDFQVRATVSP